MIERLPRLPELKRIAINKRLEWIAQARPKQLPPEDYVNVFWICGRGFGKTKCAAEETWWKSWNNDNTRTHVVAPTLNDVQKICFEGVTGLLSCCPRQLIESYVTKPCQLTLKNGSIITGYSSEVPDRLRGPQAHYAWLEELASWVYPQETYDMHSFGLRLGNNPQRLITSTPKPIQLVRDIISNPRTVTIQGSTYENKENLAPTFFEEVEKYEGTLLGRQELYGEVIDLEEMGIFKRSWFKLWPRSKPLPKFDLVIQSWDTAFSEKTTADYTAFTAWGLWKNTEGSAAYSALLLDFWQDQIGFPDMRRRAMDEYNGKVYGSSDRSSDIVIIEKKASGQSLIQEMRNSGVTVYGFDPGKTDKVQRANLVSHLVKDGYIYLPESSRRKDNPSDWTLPLLDQMCYFPNAPHDDGVDSTVQVLAYLAKTGWMKSASLPDKKSYWKRNMYKGNAGAYG